MKKVYLIVILFSIFIQPSSAQYTTAAGFRLGKFSTGVDVKHFFNTNGNFGGEFFMGYTREAKGGYLTRYMFVKQLPIFDSKLQIPVDMVFGLGANVGYFESDFFKIVDGNPVYYKGKTISAGLCGMFGLEYDSRRIPLTIGIETLPFLMILHRGPEWIDVAVTVRLKIK